MIPNRIEWKSWTTLEKISYSAQFAAALALLPTVIFSYLGLKESRLAREDQAKFFLAEKAPRIEIKNIRIDTGLLNVDLHNIGESTARNVDLENFVFVQDKPKNVDSFNEVYKVVLKSESKGINIGKNQVISIPLASILEIEKKLGYIPGNIKVAEAKNSLGVFERDALLVVTATYEDVGNGKYLISAAADIKK